jgi:hypothetical protein
MSIEIIPICHDCNTQLSNWDRFLEKKYKSPLGYILCKVLCGWLFVSKQVKRLVL